VSPYGSSRSSNLTSNRFGTPAKSYWRFNTSNAAAPLAHTTAIWNAFWGLPTAEDSGL